MTENTPNKPSVKEHVTAELSRVKEVGQLRSDRVREIVRDAVAQVTDELKAGTIDVRSIVRDAVSAAVSTLRTETSDFKETAIATIEGAIEGISKSRRQTLEASQQEMRQLQARLETEENQLVNSVQDGLEGAKDSAIELPAEVRERIDSALEALQDTEEVALLRKRYAQLQGQISLVRANLAARVETAPDRVKAYLEDASHWYKQARDQAAEHPPEEKIAALEGRIGEAGAAAARREGQIRKMLAELLEKAADAVRERR
ncbi:histidine kinase [Leptolyngbya sp. FACHB-261]|uniref:histidine kinase n=1 Tax=Leptolyngbya sp. FACHB-261 TaxID=2692806 RepID=UPI0016862598|nr:histidine kinase [Leptolyngbya sp. FACHB-261]MBD2104601.1 histidine kinase [Leptolyngbya sp. FACHB-261]